MQERCALTLAAPEDVAVLMFWKMKRCRACWSSGTDRAGMVRYWIGQAGRQAGASLKTLGNDERRMSRAPSALCSFLSVHFGLRDHASTQPAPRSQPLFALALLLHTTTHISRPGAFHHHHISFQSCIKFVRFIPTVQPADHFPFPCFPSYSPLEVLPLFARESPLHSQAIPINYRRSTSPALPRHRADTATLASQSYYVSAPGEVSPPSSPEAGYSNDA